MHMPAYWKRQIVNNDLPLETTSPTPKDIMSLHTTNSEFRVEGALALKYHEKRPPLNLRLSGVASRETVNRMVLYISPHHNDTQV
jgi:hypothetical protein